MIKIIMALVACLLWGTHVSEASRAARDVNAGNKFYNKNAYPAAIARYQKALEKDPESDIVNFNLGTAYYKNEEYKEAIGHLSRALLTADPVLRNKAHYNLGDALYKFGLSQEENNLGLAVESLEQARGHFEQSLKIDPKDADAEHNFEVVKKELERLKEKQKRRRSESDKKEQSQGGADRQDQPQTQSAEQQQQQLKDNQQSTDRSQAQEQRQTGQDNDAGQEQPADQGRKQVDRRTELPPDAVQEKMTQEEAQRMLMRYEQTEEPKGLLNLAPAKADESPVEKDW